MSEAKIIHGDAMTFGSLFAGIGGFDLGFERAGMECKWQVEIDPYCQRVLAKHWPNIRRHDDVRTFPPEPVDDWRVDVVCGGFPCQDISHAGRKAGIRGERSGMFFELMRVVRAIGPRIVVLENVAALLARGFGSVLEELAESGFDAEWDVLPACAFGAPHSRKRVFLIAHAGQIRWDRPGRDFHGRDGIHRGRWNGKATPSGAEWRDVERWLVSTFQNGDWESPETATHRMDDGLPGWLAANGFAGNAVCPDIAEWIARRIVATDPLTA